MPSLVKPIAERINQGSREPGLNAGNRARAGPRDVEARENSRWHCLVGVRSYLEQARRLECSCRQIRSRVQIYSNGRRIMNCFVLAAGVLLSLIAYAARGAEDLPSGVTLVKQEQMKWVKSAS